MTQTFLLTLTPEEPYFFGNENTFSFDPERGNQSSYIKSERLPLQTSILGVLRYLLLPVKRSDYRYTAQEQARNEQVVGKESFYINRENQNFGAISGISPLFLVKGQEKFVPTPFDHDTTVKTRYTPLSDPQSVETAEGTKWYFPQFRGKDGIADSFMNAQTGHLVAPGEIFFHNSRIQLRKFGSDRGYHKRRFVHMKQGWSIGVYVTLELDLLRADPAAWETFQKLFSGEAVFMGQTKSVFTARLTQEENRLPEMIAQHLRSGVTYCLGDTFAPQDLYDNCLFAATELRDYRAMRTTFVHSQNTDRYTGWITKGNHLHRLLRAGSVLISAPGQNAAARLANPACRKIGMNITISNGEEF